MPCHVPNFAEFSSPAATICRQNNLGEELGQSLSDCKWNLVILRENPMIRAWATFCRFFSYLLKSCSQMPWHENLGWLSNEGWVEKETVSSRVIGPWECFAFCQVALITEKQSPGGKQRRAWVWQSALRQWALCARRFPAHRSPHLNKPIVYHLDGKQRK